MSDIAQHTKHHEKMEALCGASVRAVSGHPLLYFRARKLYNGTQKLPINAAHLQADPDTDGFSSQRAISDAMALRFQHHDPAIHNKYCPTDAVERLVFELLEQIRVESLVPDRFPGVKHNLKQRFTDWSIEFYSSGLTEGQFGILLYTISQIVWARLNRWHVIEQTEDHIEATRASLVPSMGNDLKGLMTSVNNQESYAQHALTIAQLVTHLMQSTDEGPSARNREDNKELDASKFKLLLDFDDEDDEIVALAKSGESRVFDEANAAYRVFTRQYDREVDATKLVRAAQLREYRVQLDELIAKQSINVPRLSRKLAALFAEPVRDGWNFGQEEGYLDGRRLSQLLTSPTERRLFLRERHVPKADCAITFLLDCSGSMKQHSSNVSMLVDILVRALEQAGVMTEVLGFTTNTWNGGRVAKDWLRARQPEHPGRLNETCHMIFKSADASWRRNRSGIAALFKHSLFREGVDGEALQWACGRLSSRDSRRKIVVVISDGSPMDTATNKANDEFYLDNHLKAVVEGVEAQGEINVYGLGVGLDLSPFYRQCLAVDLDKGLSQEMFAEVIGLLSRH
ncbi:cobaltochelatase CobT-related protein [Leucothrix pacifica]|uniref:Cobalt chelatase n=1 Tax=Leucothrix pacifica TaxID=1247513 RepID=A0A317C8J8_9GAMM|nr:cobalt chelatase [Leucothrix pacifica]PWQ94818.1 cobalt chelatase [Leucothrix pacifica]